MAAMKKQRAWRRRVSAGDMGERKSAWRIMAAWRKMAWRQQKKWRNGIAAAVISLATAHQIGWRARQNRL